MKYTGLPAAGAGSLNEGCCPDGTGVPRAASRAHELAGLVTPGKAVNFERCVFAPVSRMVPVKLMSPGIPFRFATVPVLRDGLLPPADDGAAAGAADGDDVLEAADGVAPAVGGPDELHAATVAASSSPAPAARLRATAGRRITRTADMGGGDGMRGSLGVPRPGILRSFTRSPGLAGWPGGRSPTPG